MVIVTVFVIFLTGNLYIALLIGLPILFTIGLIILFRRTRPETPPVPLPAGPLLEPAELEGRIDRMAVEDVEIEGSAEGLFSSGPKYKLNTRHYHQRHPVPARSRPSAAWRLRLEGRRACGSKRRSIANPASSTKSNRPLAHKATAVHKAPLPNKPRLHPCHS